MTHKRFPGNITRSYRSRHALRVVGDVETWEGHAPEVLQEMLDHLALMREQGLDLIEDWSRAPMRASRRVREPARSQQ